MQFKKKTFLHYFRQLVKGQYKTLQEYIISNSDK